MPACRSTSAARSATASGFDLARREWGSPHALDDLTDAVGWAVQQGIAEPSRVAIMGMSYGGYAALAARRWRQVYAGAVSLCGISSLLTCWPMGGPTGSASAGAIKPHGQAAGL
jgi:acetyl esterase/lipase